MVRTVYTAICHSDLALAFSGEFIYSGGDKRLRAEPWMQIKTPDVVPKFMAKNLVARRSFVFARAGFGKSNLVKLLFSNLYKETPTVEKRAGQKVPVGSLIFDPDGEYYWPDDKGRPGLCDVPELQDKVVVFTPKAGPSEFYGSFVAGSIRLDIRRLRPADVISIALPPEKQDQQNVRKLKQLGDESWRQLVDEIYKNRNAADEELIRNLLGLNEQQDAEMLAARGNMAAIVGQLHDPSSQLLDKLLVALGAGKICIIDISTMRGSAGLMLSGIILQKIFDHNQSEFTKKEPKTIPTIAVVEEAQSVLGHGSNSGEGPYVSWVKEGRKYDLGALLITQQPGSIPTEILSQGDNWFVFHLLSAVDLMAVKKANAHFSDDLLSSLLNEPIPGHGVFWSSVTGKSYPLPLRVLSFEAQYSALDPAYSRPSVCSYATELNERFTKGVEKLIQQSSGHPPLIGEDQSGESQSSEDDTPTGTVDVLQLQTESAIKRFGTECSKLVESIQKGNGVTYVNVKFALMDLLPDEMVDREQQAFRLVPVVLNRYIGEGKWKKEPRPRKNDPEKVTQWVVLKL